MRIQKRTLVRYLVLNCLTLGIYGFIVAKDMGNEINALCKDDKQEPGLSYPLAWLVSKFGIGALYYSYWWYQQANRLKVNACRYGLKVKESGTDIFLFRSVLNIPLAAVTALEIGLAMLVPTLVALLFVAFAPIMSILILGFAGLILLLFWNELTAGANIANYYMMKNLNRFADAVKNGGGAPFDPMAYENYPSISVKYPAMIGGVAPAQAPVQAAVQAEVSSEEIGTSLLSNDPAPAPAPAGLLLGEKGTCAGYKFDLAPGEEIVIGKDARESQVVIDPSYKEISRKHVGITFISRYDNYRVVDYSSNGTWANGTKLVPNKPVSLPRGTVLELANGKNRFQLG